MKTIRTNKFVRKIQSEIGATDPYIAVQQLVARYRASGDTLERLAERLGVIGITVTKMAFDGGIFEEPSGLSIRLNAKSTPKRRRFTLAHEIAHLIVAAGNARGARRSHACTDLERACDTVAAELLMPFDEFCHAARGDASTARLLALADEFEVSPHAAAVRLNELGVWTESMGLWSWDGDARELWFVGKRLWPEKTIYMSTFELAVRRGSYKGSEMITSLGRGAFPVFLDVRRLGTERVYVIAVLWDSYRRRG